MNIMLRVSSVGRTAASYAESHRFNSDTRYSTSVAQLVEHQTDNLVVLGSIPSTRTVLMELNSVVECLLYTQKVGGSNPSAPICTIGIVAVRRPSKSETGVQFLYGAPIRHLRKRCLTPKLRGRSLVVRQRTFNSFYVSSNLTGPIRDRSQAVRQRILNPYHVSSTLTGPITLVAQRTEQRVSTAMVGSSILSKGVLGG